MGFKSTLASQPYSSAQRYDELYLILLYSLDQIQLYARQSYSGPACLYASPRQQPSTVPNGLSRSRDICQPGKLHCLTQSTLSTYLPCTATHCKPPSVLQQHFADTRLYHSTVLQYCASVLKRQTHSSMDSASPPLDDDCSSFHV